MATKPEPTEEREDRRGAPKGSFGQPPHVPTPEGRLVVKTLIAVGASHELIAHKLGISPDTLTRHYDAEIAYGLEEANAAVGGTLFQIATGRLERRDANGNTSIEQVEPHVIVRAAQFWQDRRGGSNWRARNRAALPMEGGEPVDVPDDDEVKPLKINITFVRPALPAPSED